MSDSWNPGSASRGPQQHRKAIVTIIAGIGVVLVALIVLVRPHRARIGELIGDLKKLSAGETLPSNADQPVVAATKPSKSKPSFRRPGQAKDQAGAEGESSSLSIADPESRAAPPVKQAEPLQFETLQASGVRRQIELRGGPAVKLKDWTTTPRVQAGKDDSAVPGATSLPSVLTVGSASWKMSGFQEIAGEVPQQHEVPGSSPVALQNDAPGTVVVRFVVGKDGTVQDVRLVSGSPVLASAVIDAVRKWRYLPYYRNGEPIAVERQITVEFMISPK